MKDILNKHQFQLTKEIEKEVIIYTKKISGNYWNPTNKIVYLIHRPKYNNSVVIKIIPEGSKHFYPIEQIHKHDYQNVFSGKCLSNKFLEELFISLEITKP
jgi:hypothetical protein